MSNAVHPAIARFNKWFYSWIDTTDLQPTPGAEAAAFAKQMLPIAEWDGSGEPVMYQLQAFAPQIYVNQMIVPTGIAGIAAGQFGPNDLSEPEQ
jgi:hypothetical protein